MSTAGDFHRAWRNLPIGRLDDIIGGGWCLILAPHPDDESLGCGGLIAACVAAGRMPLVVVLTDGAGSHPNSRSFPPDRLRAVRAREVREAVGCLGLLPDRVVFLGEPDAASLAAAAVARAAGIRHVAYPVWGWMLPANGPVAEQPGGGWRLGIGKFLVAKRRAIRAHRTQYSGLITDDPSGFQLPTALLSVFDTPLETFLETQPA